VYNKINDLIKNANKKIIYKSKIKTNGLIDSTEEFLDDIEWTELD